MKYFVLVLMVVTFNAEARQYIQCAHYETDDRAVINLNGEKSTLFLTNGVHLPDEIRILKDLHFVENNGTVAIYETREGSVKERVQVPVFALGQALRHFDIIMGLERLSSGHSTEFPMSCFSSLYED